MAAKPAALSSGSETTTLASLSLAEKHKKSDRITPKSPPYPQPMPADPLVGNSKLLSIIPDSILPESKGSLQSEAGLNKNDYDNNLNMGNITELLQYGMD